MIFDDSPAVDSHCGIDAPDLNYYEIGAIAGVSLLAINGLAVCATVAPVSTAVMAGTSAGFAYVGNRKRNDLPLNPFDKGEEVKSEPAPATEPVAQAPDQPVQVEGFDGQPQMV